MNNMRVLGSVIVVLLLVHTYSAQQTYIVENTYATSSSCGNDDLLVSDFLPSGLCMNNGGYFTSFVSNGSYVLGVGYNDSSCSPQGETDYFFYQLNFCYTNDDGYAFSFIVAKTLAPLTTTTNVAVVQNFADSKCQVASDTLFYYVPTPCFYAGYQDCLDANTVADYTCENYDCSGQCNQTVATLVSCCVVICFVFD